MAVPTDEMVIHRLTECLVALTLELSSTRRAGVELPLFDFAVSDFAVPRRRPMLTHRLSRLLEEERVAQDVVSSAPL
jgi:hypothetical protein